jgi:hypothetical protein
MNIPAIRSDTIGALSPGARLAYALIRISELHQQLMEQL